VDFLFSSDGTSAKDSNLLESPCVGVALNFDILPSNFIQCRKALKKTLINIQGGLNVSASLCSLS